MRERLTQGETALMPRFRRSPAALAAAGAALFLSAGAAAWAATDGPGHDQTASAKKAKPHTNRGPRGRRGPQGPQGPQGLPGSAGAPGAQGATGPSDGYIARVAAPTSLPAGTATAVVQLALPAGGAYIVHGSDRTRGHEHCRGFRELHAPRRSQRDWWRIDGVADTGRLRRNDHSDRRYLRRHDQPELQPLPPLPKRATTSSLRSRSARCIPRSADRRGCHLPAPEGKASAKSSPRDISWARPRFRESYPGPSRASFRDVLMEPSPRVGAGSLEADLRSLAG